MTIKMPDDDDDDGNLYCCGDDNDCVNFAFYDMMNVYVFELVFFTTFTIFSSSRFNIISDVILLQLNLVLRPASFLLDMGIYHA